MKSQEQSFAVVKDLVFQPMLFTLNLQFKSSNVSLIRCWLEDVYSICRDDFTKHRINSNRDSAGQHELSFFTFCIAAMSQLMLKELNCPIFDRPEVVSIIPDTQKNNEFEVGFRFSNIGFVSAGTIKSVLVFAFQMCSWLGQKGRHNTNLRKDGLRHLHNEILNKFSALNSIHYTNMKLFEAAHKIGIHYCQVGEGIYRLGWGKSSILLCGSLSPDDSIVGMSLVSDKSHTAQLLRAAGLSVPVHREVSDSITAMNVAKALSFPVVVKPVDCERGEGVSVDLYDEDSTQQAFRLAQVVSKSKRILIEKQVAGVCHRLFMVKGKLLYAVKRWPPSVFGDGFSNVKMLVEAGYQQELLKLPSERKPLVPWDIETASFIQQIGLTEDYVPEVDERISLRRIESTQWGGFDEEVTHQVHPDTLRQAAIACCLVQLTVVGVDVITEDISQPLSQTGGVINELNAGPLLGGGDISRSYIPEYLRRLMPDQGRIGIAIFPTTHGAKAKVNFAQQLEQGKQCYLTTDSITLDYKGEEMFHAQMNLVDRLRQLIFHPDVESICIVTDYWGSTDAETLEEVDQCYT